MINNDCKHPFFISPGLLCMAFAVIILCGCVKLNPRGGDSGLAGVAFRDDAVTLRGTVNLGSLIEENALQISVFINESKQWMGFGEVESPEQSEDGRWLYSWSFGSPDLEAGVEVFILAINSQDQGVLASKTASVSSSELYGIELWDEFPLSGVISNGAGAAASGNVYVINRHVGKFQDLMEDTAFLGQLEIKDGAFEGTVSSGSGYLLVSLEDGAFYISDKPVDLPLSSAAIDTSAMAKLDTGVAQQGIAEDTSFTGSISGSGGTLQGGMIFIVKSTDSDIEPLGVAEINAGAFSGFRDPAAQSGYLIANITNLNGLNTYISNKTYFEFSGMSLNLGRDFTLREAAAESNFTGTIMDGKNTIKQGIVYIIPNRAEAMSDLPQTDPASMALIQNSKIEGAAVLATGYMVAGIGTDLYISKTEYRSPFTNIKLDLKDMNHLGNWAVADANFTGAISDGANPVKEGMVFIVPNKADTMADLPQKDPASLALIQDGQFTGNADDSSGYLVVGIGTDIYTSKKKYSTPFTGLKLDLKDMNYLGNWAGGGESFTGSISNGADSITEGMIFIIAGKVDGIEDLPQTAPTSIAFIQNGEFMGSADLSSGYLVVGIDADVYASKTEYSAPFTGLKLNLEDMNPLGSWAVPAVSVQWPSDGDFAKFSLSGFPEPDGVVTYVDIANDSIQLSVSDFASKYDDYCSTVSEFLKKQKNIRIFNAVPKTETAETYHTASYYSYSGSIYSVWLVLYKASSPVVMTIEIAKEQN